MRIMTEEISGTGLIRTKYSKPETNRYLISRQRLHQKLNNSLMCRLTMVTAPAGYGKTTAVLDWLGKCGLPAAWLSVDSYDNNPMVFWRYVCTALDSISDGISKNTEYIFSSQELLKSNIHISILIDWLSEVQSDFLLVLDDLHLITDSSILEGLSYLIDYLPAKMHLIFISRTLPELELAKHRIKWQVQRLEEEDLRFGEEEIVRFYQAHGITLKSDELDAVGKYTDGWAAALVAVTLSMEDGSGHDALAALSRSGRDIGQYLRDEVIRDWLPEKRFFAMKTSILDTLWPDLCNAVTGDNNGDRLLKEIAEGNGFLAALDGQRQAYRYHHLLKSFLREMLQEIAPEEIPQLYMRAGCWFQEQGSLPESIECFLSGGAYERAYELIEHQVDHLIHKNDFGRLLSWVERLPDEYRDNSFKSAAIYALYYAETGQYDLSRQWIDKMKTLKDDARYVSLPSWEAYSSRNCIMVEANLLLRQGDIMFLPLISLASSSEGFKNYKMPEYNDFNTADIYFYRCPISKLTALIKETPEKYDTVVGDYRRMISKNPGYAPLTIGAYLYESNRLEEALPYLLKAIDEAAAAGCPGALVPATVDIVRMKRALGDMPGAFKSLEECEKKLRNYGKAHWIYLIRTFRCRLFMDIGDRAGVEEWFAARRLDIYTEINRTKEFELIVYARVLMAKGCMHDARILLQRLLSFTEDNARLHSRVEVLNLLALLEYESNQISRALNYVEGSLQIGMKEGYVRSFMDESVSMGNLLRYYITRKKKRIDRNTALALSAYARSLLKQMHEYLPLAYEKSAAAPTEGILEVLTEQEKKVLKLIVEADTNQEIGEKLGIGLRTVKNHISNIYGKLGVKNRAWCIKLLREADRL